MNLMTIDRAIRPELHQKKYALMATEEFTIPPELTYDRQQLWASWDNLRPDNYLQDEARYGYDALVCFAGGSVVNNFW